VDISLDFALLGGHRLIASALRGARCDAVADAAAEAAAAALAHLPPGWGFPVAPAPFFEPLPPPLSFSLGTFLSAPAASGGGALGAALRCGGAPLPPVAVAAAPPVLVRRIPPQAQRQRAQEDVGFLLWPCALPLARWVVAHRQQLLGCAARRRVLELGAGVGLVGLAAGIFALPPFCGGACACARGAGGGGGGGQAEVLLTDFNPAVLQNLRHNAALNEPALHTGAAGAAAGAAGGGAGGDEWGAARLCALAPHARAPLFSVQPFDWAAEDAGDGAPLGGVAPFNLILGSDIICSDEDAALVAGVLRRRLAPRGAGVAVICSPPPFNRWGVAHLPAALAAEGLTFVEEVMAPVFLADAYVGEGEEEGARARAAERGRALAEDVATGAGFEAGCRLWIVTRGE
jgi:predicted nicotinamide N-methyase